MHPDLQFAVDAAEQFIDRWIKRDDSCTLLVLAGWNGVGKTLICKKIISFCARCAIRVWEKHGLQEVPGVTLYRWPELEPEFNEGFSPAIEEMKSEDMIGIDDIKAANDPWRHGIGKLYQVLSRRERKYTVVTTDAHPSQWGTVFDQRIEDRLLRNSMVVNLFSKELRSYQAWKAGIS